MATKKRRGFSGTPKQHEDRAERELADAVSYAKDVVKSAKSGVCGRAFDKYEQMTRSFARAQQDEYDAGIGDGIVDEQVALKLRSAALAMRNSCLVNYSLSGMKRRSRR